MLCLTRKPGETIYISSDVVVRVVRLRGNRVTLGVEAPQTKTVLRGELVERPPEKEAA